MVPLCNDRSQKNAECIRPKVAGVAGAGRNKCLREFLQGDDDEHDDCSEHQRPSVDTNGPAAKAQIREEGERPHQDEMPETLSVNGTSYTQLHTAGADPVFTE